MNGAVKALTDSNFLFLQGHHCFLHAYSVVALPKFCLATIQGGAQMSLGGTFVQIKSTVADDRSICMATRFSQAASNHERVHKLSVIELSHLVEAIKK